MPEILVAEEHVQVYEVWKERGLMGLALSHIDFHDDMRGLLIDRRRGRAWLIDRGDPRIRAADSGNFLAHAVVEGRVASVRWIHDGFGGRAHDIGTVKYESDLTALPHRLLHKLRGEADFPLRFEELLFERWRGPEPGEHLDIDWDGLASVDYDPARIERLTRLVLELPFPAIPEVTNLVYSPGYSHPDRGLMEEFLAALAGKLQAKVVRLPPPPPLAEKAAPRRFAEAAEKRVVLALKRIGIH